MTVDVKLPQFGMGMSAGLITRWYKAVGDQVTEDEPLVEIETEKSAAEVVAPASGILSAILAAEGMNVPVYEVIGTIEEQ